MVRCSRAARMFAGNKANKRKARQTAAKRLVAGTSNPMAPRISSIPVTVTRSSGCGKAGGTMRIKSGRPFPQCAEAVSRNIRKRAMRRGRATSLSAVTPTSPAPRRIANETTRTMRGTMLPISPHIEAKFSGCMTPSLGLLLIRSSSSKAFKRRVRGEHWLRSRRQAFGRAHDACSPDSNSRRPCRRSIRRGIGFCSFACS